MSDDACKYFNAARRYLDCCGGGEGFVLGNRFLNFVAWCEIFSSVNCLLGIIEKRGGDVEGSLVLCDLYNSCSEYDNLSVDENKFLTSFGGFIDTINEWNDFFVSGGNAIFKNVGDVIIARDLYNLLNSFLDNVIDEDTL